MAQVARVEGVRLRTIYERRQRAERRLTGRVPSSRSRDNTVVVAPERRGVPVVSRSDATTEHVGDLTVGVLLAVAVLGATLVGLVGDSGGEVVSDGGSRTGA